MTYLFLFLLAVLVIAGIWIVNKISSKSQEVRDELHLEIDVKQECVDKSKKTLESLIYEYYYYEYEMEQDFKEREKNIGFIKHQNIKGRLDNIERKQINSINYRIIDDKDDKVSNRNKLEYSHIN